MHPQSGRGLLPFSYEGPVSNCRHANGSSSTRQGQNAPSPPRHAKGGHDTKQEKAAAFQRALLAQADKLRERLQHSEYVHHIKHPGPSFEDSWARFRETLFSTSLEHKNNELVTELKSIYRLSGASVLQAPLELAFFDIAVGSALTPDDIAKQQLIADLRYPVEWYPRARASPRDVHLHVGPTNSGKTYHALKRLESAKSGLYAGPLRLLAHEVYSRLNEQGKPCMLLTGEERRQSSVGDAYAPMLSCTVEMVPLNQDVEVAVLDEIQMIGNVERGWAWTQALLGLRAAEIHLCGETRTVPLIRQICDTTGDRLHVHEYQRLSPLNMSPTSLAGDLSRLRKGDCIVCFSIVNIHHMRKQIEKITGKSVAIVYGNLPPETRANQARLFNDPTNDYDFLVASDAIGMGLNLSIKRIIFETTSKFNGISTTTIDAADLKQIAGRAGRYKVATFSAPDLSAPQPQTDPLPPSLAVNSAEAHVVTPGVAAPQQFVDFIPDDSRSGLVTTLEKFDFPVVKKAMASEPPPIRTAGLFPSPQAVFRLSQYYPRGTPLSFILHRFAELGQTNDLYHKCVFKDKSWVADLIQPVHNLTIPERLLFSACPASKRDEDMLRQLLPSMARCVTEQSGGSFIDLPEIPLEVLQADPKPTRARLRELESLHKAVVLYLWLGYRFAGIFPDRRLAFHVKTLVEEQITVVLDGLDTSLSAIDHRRSLRRLTAEGSLDADLTEDANDNSGLREGDESNDVPDETRLSTHGIEGIEHARSRADDMPSAL